MAASVAVAPAAEAATAWVDGDVLRYQAGPGEFNRLSVTETAAGFELVERPKSGPDFQVTAGSGCTALFAQGVSCTAPGLDRIEISLGDGNDHVRVEGSALPLLTTGGEGDDEFEESWMAGDGPREFAGGPGDDVVRTSALADDPHDFAGGEGRDFIDYHSRTGPVQVTLDDVADDGAPGEGDNVHSDVESVVGGADDDLMVGTGADNSFQGNGGADAMFGLGGNDHLTASLGCDADVLDGGSGADVLWPGGNNEVHGGPGDDRLLNDYRPCPEGAFDDISGGAGVDTADFRAGYYPPMSVSLDDVADDGFEGVDNYHSDIENATSTHGGMVLIGNDGPNVLTGREGDDLLIGAGGDDQLIGGDGLDVADYSDHIEPVTLTLNGQADDGTAGEHDQIATDIEDLRGGSGNDRLVGNFDDNFFDGGEGADTISGGLGFDAVDYSARTTAVHADLDGAVGDDGEAGEGDTVGDDVEGLMGGMGDDVLIGGASSGFLIGFEGDDQLRDSGGMDELDAGEGADSVDVRDLTFDTVVCGSGPDVLVGDGSDEVADDCEEITRATSPPGAQGTPRPPQISVPRQPRPPTTRAPSDRSAPTGSATVGKRQRLRRLLSRGLTVRINSSESATASVVLLAESSTRRRLRKLGLPHSAPLARAEQRVRAEVPTTLRLRLLDAGRRVLRSVPAAKLRLELTLTDAAGNHRRLTRHLSLWR